MGLLMLMGDSGGGLLDRYTAAVAYSLRKLRTRYTGAAIRVRRSSDSTEQDIGFAGTVLDTASLVSFCGAGNGFVTTWYDQVGSNNAVQTTAAIQPQIVSSGSLIVSETNKPSIAFVDASGAAVGPYLEHDPFYVASQSYVGYLAVHSLVGAGFSHSIFDSNPANRGVFLFYSGATRQPGIYSNRSGANSAIGSALTLNETVVFYGQANRTRINQFINTTVEENAGATDPNTDLTMPTKCWIGNSNTAVPTCNNKISELIGFTADQSSNQLAIRTNASNYWRA
jgi:hypothetical protein